VDTTSALAPIVRPPLVAVATPAPYIDQAAAAAKVNQAMRAVLPDVQVGFEIFDRIHGAVLTSQDADRPVASMSVVKLLIALDVLAGGNGVTQDSAMQQELHQMLANSDDQIANKLWIAGGGPDIVTRMASLRGLTGTSPPDDPGAWGDTRTTPRDIVQVYRYITDQLANADQNLVLGALADTPKIAADGFDQHFGIPNGMPRLSWAVKQGWGTSDSQAVMNSTGMVGAQWRYIVVVFASAPASSYATLPKVVTAGAKALASVACAAS
jgi:hypothetical protein